MKLAIARILIVVAALPLAGTGCASAIPDAGMTAAAEPARVERRKLADGVELVVDPSAGPEAVRVAEMIQSEMRARYLGAR